MAVRDRIERDLNPAYVLHVLREGNLQTEAQLFDHFGFGELTVSRWQEGVLLSDRGRVTLESILDELKSAELVKVDEKGHLKVTSNLRSLQKALRFSLRQLSHRFASEQTPQAAQIRKTLELLQSKTQDSVIADLVNTLREVHECFINHSNLAAIILSGRILEICLKHALSERTIKYEDNWTLGKLTGCLREKAPQLMLESSHGQMCDIITQSRNCAVHAGDRIFSPGDGEVTLVVAAMLALVKKLVIE